MPGELSSPAFLGMNLVAEKCELVQHTNHHAHQNPKPKTEQSCFYLCQNEHDSTTSPSELKTLFPCISSRTYSVDKNRFSFLMCQVSA